MATSSTASIIFPFLLLFTPIFLGTFTVVQSSFRCSSPPATTCNALVDYVSTNATTVSALQALFTVRNLRSILGANNLSATTPRNHVIEANQTVKIPFPCICRNGTGISNRRPLYTVVPQDDLYHIAVKVFSGLVTVQDIQAVNNISNPALIFPGQSLWIPLPCSCDDVDGQKVVHYGHLVAPGSSVEGIAAQFNISQDTLLRLNNLSSPRDLLAGAVLDVPLRTCSSTVNNRSLDYPLLVPNNTYVFTASNCVSCKCDAAANWVLQCQPSALANTSCPAAQCEGAESFFLGNTSTSGCNHTTCAYAGHDNQRILTTITSEWTCPASGGGSSAAGIQGWSWNKPIVLMHILLLFCSVSPCIHV